jgi:hypothetical protein
MIGSLVRLQKSLSWLSEKDSALRISKLISLANQSLPTDNSEGQSEQPSELGPITLPGDNKYTYKYIPPGKGDPSHGGGDYFEVVTDLKDDNIQRVGFKMGPDNSGYKKLMNTGLGSVMTLVKEYGKDKGTVSQPLPESTPDSMVEPASTRPDESIELIDAIANNLVKVKQNVDIENITPDTRKFINELGRVAQVMGAERPVITSGYRSKRSQARVIIDNWKSNGGKNGGDQYLISLYGTTNGAKYSSIIAKYKIGEEGEDRKGCIEELFNYLKEIVGSSHTKEPGQALDIRWNTDKILPVLHAIRDGGRFNISIIDETWTSGPHYHVTVHSANV